MAEVNEARLTSMLLKGARRAQIWPMSAPIFETIRMPTSSLAIAGGKDTNLSSSFRSSVLL
jgi:hypothetical protein